MARYCANCGAEVGPETKFCPACGTPQPAAEAQPPADVPGAVPPTPVPPPAEPQPAAVPTAAAPPPGAPLPAAAIAGVPPKLLSGRLLAGVLAGVAVIGVVAVIALFASGPPAQATAGDGETGGVITTETDATAPGATTAETETVGETETTETETSETETTETTTGTGTTTTGGEGDGDGGTPTEGSVREYVQEAVGDFKLADVKQFSDPKYTDAYFAGYAKPDGTRILHFVGGLTNFEKAEADVRSFADYLVGEGYKQIGGVSDVRDTAGKKLGIRLDLQKSANEHYVLWSNGSLSLLVAGAQVAANEFYDKSRY